MKSNLFLLMFICLCSAAYSQQTIFEKSGGTKTVTYFEAIDWYKQLSKKTAQIKIVAKGLTDAGYPLHLVTISKDGKHDPTEWHRQGKLVILINNGIHPGEPDGIDASLMLARDLLNKKINLPNNVVIAFIPVYNIGGSLNRNSYSRVNQNGPDEYGFRGNAQNLDLNRDFTKADSKNAKSFAEIFHSLDPHILIDNHVSDGADFQHTMTLISTQYEKLGAELGGFLKTKLEPEIYSAMAKKNWDLIPYVDFQHNDISQGMTMFYDPPRYSTGYAALFQTLAFMPETHMLKPYPARVQSTYDLMVVFIELASLHGAEIIKLRTETRAAILQQSKFALRWVVDSSRHGELLFKGYETDSAISEASGLRAMYYNRNKPYGKKIPFYNYFRGEMYVDAPVAYVIPQGWFAAIALLQNNGVQVQRLLQDSSFEVGSYRIESYKSLNFPYEKHHKNYAVTVSKKKEKKSFRKGDFLVFTKQPGKRYLIEMLEPEGDDSFFSWNFFDGILQQKEGYSDYRWNDLAASWLKTDTVLQRKLAYKKRLEPDFAQNHRAILNFIYKNSPYYEPAHLQYPVYRIE